MGARVATDYRQNHDFRRNPVANWGFPTVWPDSGLSNGNPSCDFDSISEPPQMAPAPDPPPRPEPPIHSVIHEYSWPDAGANAATKFAVVFKDGQVRFATAIWVQDGALNLSGDSTGDTIRADLDAVDMESTRKLNAAAGLRWPLAAR